MNVSTPTAEEGLTAPAPPHAIRGEYQRASATMTLREGLREYYRVNPGLSVPEKIKDEKSARYFHNHDCTHVVFGTHTGLLDEGVNDMLTIFGVELPVWDYAAGFYATDESKSIMKEVLVFPAVVALWRTFRLIPKAWRASRRMKKKWPWDPPAELLDRPLTEIREEYGIEVWRPEVELGLAEG